MSRVIVCAVLLLTGCAAESERIVTRVKTVEKVVERPVVKTRTCTVTREIGTICGREKSCRDPTMTCAEAYHRLTVCKEDVRDGGVAGGSKGPDGIPCEEKCGNTALAMAKKIREETEAKRFVLPVQQSAPVCSDPV